MSIKFPNIKHFFFLFLAAVMMVSLLAVNAHAANSSKITDYGDAYGHWAYEALSWAVDNGVLVGTSEDKLSPNDNLTRAQMAAMIDRLFGTYESTDISRYTDVSRGSWHYDYIAQAVHMGTFTGYSGNRMGPDEYITREQALVILARTICLPAAGSSTLSQFPDRGDVNTWAVDSVSAMVERGYISGYSDGRLNPKGKITRAEMAQIMCNIFQSVHDSGEITGSYQSTVLVRGEANIHDAVFDGDLILANGLGEKFLDLNNITVKGRLVVWGGSAINVSGKSTVAGVVMARNDGPVQVIFDAAATKLSEKNCSIVKPSGMNQNNEVLFTDKANAPTIAFDLPAYLYVGDSATVKTILTDADAITWELTRNGKSCDMPDGFTKDGGMFYFMEAGRYTLKGIVENSGGTGSCEKTVEVLPIGDIAFSLSEYGYTDRAEDVTLLTKNDLDGAVAWTLTKDGDSVSMPEGFTRDGGTLALTETGVYTLTATLTDAAGKQYTASQTITILPVIVPTLTASADKVYEDETVEIGLTMEGGEPAAIRWALTCGGEDASATLSDNGGTLAFDGAGDYTLTAIAVDAQGREFSSEPASIKAIPNLSLSLTSDLDKLHEDETAAISLTVEHGTPSTVAWALTHDGEGVSVSLGDNGGTLTFDEAGDYLLSAAVTDELGKEYTAALPLEVSPVIDLTPDVPETPPVDQSGSVTDDLVHAFSTATEIPVQDEAPMLTIDNATEHMDSTADMEYSTDSGTTWRPCTEPLDVSGLAGKDILIRYPGGEDVTVKLPARRKAPNIGVSGNTLTGTDRTMEYRLLPDSEWMAITGDTVKNLAPGTYEIRYVAAPTETASEVQTVVIDKNSVSDLDASVSKMSLLNRKDHIAYISGRTNTQAAPNDNITRAEVAAILYRLLTREAKSAYETNINHFSDVSADAWYNAAVSTLTDLGVVTGYQDGTFGPDQNITRAELATILARFYGPANDSTTDRFTDISDSWMRKHINLAADAGLVNGYEDGTFRPNQNITRAETIVMVNRILERDVSADTVVNGYKTFSDVADDAWFYWDVVEASNLHTYGMNGSTEKWDALG